MIMMLKTASPPLRGHWLACPVCPHLYADPAAAGPTTDPASHRCDRTLSYTRGVMSGLRTGALDPPARPAQRGPAGLVAAARPAAPGAPRLVLTVDAAAGRSATSLRPLLRTRPRGGRADAAGLR